MIVLMVITTGMVLIAGWLLFAPFFLEIDTRVGLYRVRFHRMASVRLCMEGNGIIEVRLAFWSKRINLLDRKRGTTPAPKKTGVKSAQRKKQAVPLGKMIRVMKSFRLNRFWLTLDTGNEATNGILYPCFGLLAWYTGKDVSINFTGRNEIVLETENNIARMLWAYFKT